MSFPNIQCCHSGSSNGRAGCEAFTHTLLDNGVSFSARSVCLCVHVGLHACGSMHYSGGLHGVVCECTPMHAYVPVASGTYCVALCSLLYETPCVGKSVSLQVGVTGSLISEEECGYVGDVCVFLGLPVCFMHLELSVTVGD